jgi:hypothetical protein
LRIFEVEFGVSNACLGVLDGGPRGILLVGALVDRLLGCEFVVPKRLRARELRIGQFDARRRVPPTCARNSTRSIAENWPRKPARVSTSRRKGSLTVTCGAGGIAAAV